MALQAEQSRYQPVPANVEQPPSVQPDPNFMQLSRVGSSVLPRGSIAPPNLPNDGSNPAYSPFGNGAALDLLRTAQMQHDQYHPRPLDGIDYDVLGRLITGHESRGRPDAKNGKSTATGAGQFIEKTWIGMLARHRPDIVALHDPGTDEGKRELLALRYDPELSGEMTKAYARDNAQMLRNAKFPVTPGNIYLSHFAGPTGARAVLGADPSTRVASILKKDALDANTKNPNLRAMNAGELRVWADRAVAEQARKMQAEKQIAIQRAFSLPQPSLPTYPQQSNAAFPFVPLRTP